MSQETKVLGNPKNPVVVDENVLSRLIDNLQSAPLEKVMRQFAERVETSAQILTNKEDFLVMIEDEANFHRTIDAFLVDKKDFALSDEVILEQSSEVVYKNDNPIGYSLD